MSFITYEKESGKIISLMDAPNDHKDYYITDAIGSVILGDDIERANIKNHYIVDDKFVLREAQATTINKTTLTADGIDTIEITNSPTGIFTATNSETITGEISGSDTFATTIAGTYRITITSFPYLDFTATIEAI